jgi:hypothetical protein
MEASADWSNTSKRRRREPKSLEAIREAFVQNRKKLVEALDKMSEREDWRHQEMLEIENKKLEASRKSSQAFVGVLQLMAQAMAMLGQSFGNNPLWQ